MNVHVGAACVVRHVIEHAVDAQRRAVSNAETNAGESASTVVVGVAQILIAGALKLVAGANTTGAKDELALPAQESKREIVIQARGERVRIYFRDPVIRRDVVILRRIVAVAFQLPTGIREENAKTSAVA
jgi:hypothetical protein